MIRSLLQSGWVNNSNHSDWPQRIFQANHERTRAFL
uniref:Uncharacterized protein n=1 Tax=Rhizophora mucronata TaxID=61149 RepID=A0A2P2NA47_RHIMU